MLWILPGVKAAEAGVDSPFMVKNQYSHTSTPPLALRGMLSADLQIHLFHNIYGVELDVREFLTLALSKDKWTASRRVRFTPEITAIGTLLVRGWFGTRGVLNIQQN